MKLPTQPRSYVIMALCFLITIYFCYHAVQGARGIRRMEQLKTEIALASEIATQTAQEKELLRKKVHSLSANSLDLDQLEESALRVLNMGKPEDKVILK